MRRIVGIRRQTIRKEEEEGEEKRIEGIEDKLSMCRRNENGRKDKQRNGAEKKRDQTQRH